MFILEGLPAIVLGCVTLVYLTDHPRQATWLNPHEREWLADAIQGEIALKRAVRRWTVGQALRDSNALLMAASLFFAVVGGYGFLFWLPTAIKTASGTSTVTATALSAMPFALGMAAVAAAGWSSDRTGERRLHA